MGFLRFVSGFLNCFPRLSENYHDNLQLVLWLCILHVIDRNNKHINNCLY